jgi:photosystem II stability/assembly factor-like uncharacterized protein
MQRIVLVLTLFCFTASGQAADALKALKFREIGPANMGGRIDDVAVVESNPSTFYIGLASGGVWKTVNGGTTLTPIFDNEAVSSIGDIAIAPSDPSILYVGTGEPNNRQSSSWGNGVYKSTDAGQTWTHVGLEKTHHIGRIAVHPTNPDIVYVAAVGRLWGPNKERGVYKTTDGGKTWQQVLFVNEDTGAIDIAVDPESPGTVYAGFYQRRRTVYGYNGSGPHGGIYKTTDGGATWKKLTKGFPAEGTGEIGRMAVAIYRRNPNIVYALYEHRNGGTYRSEDKGETWVKMSDTNPRPSYYSKIVIDPNNDQRIWVLGAPLYFSEDGGKTFVQTRGQRIHSDHHSLWINPANSEHMLLAGDGGLHQSFDRGKTWEHINTIAIGQFYEVAYDFAKPYNVCGGLQDNGTWCGPSTTVNRRGITNADWINVNGGDGFYAQIDPKDPDLIYVESQDGNVARRNLRTGESRSIRPAEKDGEERFRFQWSTPIWISLHDNKTIYYPGNILFRSRNQGDDWEKASPDLTTNVERDKLPIMGKAPDAATLSRHDGVQQYPTSTTFSESPLTPDVLWVGTDDGNLQVTRDGGKNWKNVAGNVKGVPKGTYVSRVVASRACEGCALATFDGHRSDDFNIYVYETRDFGETWKDISKGLPRNNGVVNVIREHHRNTNLLFAGTEFGAYFSLDRGANWQQLKLNLPTVPVDDIQIHPRENDLILATHGRSIWILDDITPLEEMSDKLLNSELTLLPPRPATMWRPRSTDMGFRGDKSFSGPNAPLGATFTYFLKKKLEGRGQVRLTIRDAAGKTVRELTGVNEAGFQRVTWDLRMAAAAQPTQEMLQMARERGIDPEQAMSSGAGAAFGFGGGPRVEPGEYTVEITAGSAKATQKVTVGEDPNIVISEADRKLRREFIDKIYALQQANARRSRTVARLRTQLTALMDSWRGPGAQQREAAAAGAPDAERGPRGGGALAAFAGFGAPRVPDNVRKSAEELSKQIDEVNGKLFSAGGQGRAAMGAAGPPLVWTPPPASQRLGRLMAALEGWTAAPTATQREEFAALEKTFEGADEKVKALEEGAANLEKLMREAQMPYLPATPAVGAGAGFRRGGEEPR